MSTKSFSFTGQQESWTVPTGVTSITVTLIGGAGGSSTLETNTVSGGKGGKLIATINVTAGTTIYAYVGGQGTSSSYQNQSDANHSGGFNGGGSGGNDTSSQIANGAGGGGASDIRIGGTALSNRILVAGGGGGSGSKSGAGGNGGGTTGQEGSNSTINGTEYGDGGGGGTQTAGGDVSNNRGSSDGTLGSGGNAGNQNAWGSGGGGGGYYGGAAGSSTQNHDLGHPAGGGGGSSYFNANYITSGTTTTNTQGDSNATGNGSIVIAYTITSPYITSTTIVSNNTTLTTTFSEAVYSTYSSNTASGTLDVNDFILSLTNGQATLTSSTPSSISISGNSYTLGLPISGIANGLEKISVNPANNAIFDSDGNTATSQTSNNFVYLTEKIVPYITGTTINSNNSAIDVTFNEPVFNSNSGSGGLQTSDFQLSIASGVASLNSTTPISISQSNNTFTLGISINGIPNGAEVLTVKPISNSIFDAKGNVADSTDQSNNTINLNDKSAPTIAGTTIANDNTSVTVTFSEAVFDTPNNSGALEVGDFQLSLSNGVATLGSTTPTNISSSGNAYTLGLNISGTPNGSEQLTVNILANSIYDSKGNVASTTQSNNTVNLKDKVAPTITGTTVATDNQSITVTFSEAVFNSSNGSGALQVSDFTLSKNGGEANLTSSTPTSISISNNSYTLGLAISGTPNGSESISVLPVSNSIFDAGGNVANSTNQSNNTVSLFDKKPPTITGTTLNATNNLVTTTFSDAVSRASNSNIPLLVGSFSLSISGGIATLGSTTPISISISGNSYALGFSLVGTPNGSEVLTVSPVSNSIYDLNGNVAATSQSNNTVTINAPRISSVSLANDNSTISVTFNKAVFNSSNGSGSLEKEDFAFLLYGGVATLSSNTPSSISSSGNVYTLGISLTGTPNGSETLVVNPASISSIFDAGGIPALTSQSNNTTLINEKILPVITSTTINNANTLVSVTFSEAVFNTANNTGALDVNDFVFSIAGGAAALTSTAPSSISSSGNTYTLGLSLSNSSSNTPNGSETLTVNPQSNSIYDSKGNVASNNQSANNTVKLIEKVAPYFTAISNINNSTISITFNEDVFTNSDGTGELQTTDFTFSLTGGTASLTSTTPSSISKTNNIYILGVSLNSQPNGSEVLVVNPSSSTAIYDKAGNVALASQSNNSVNLKETTPPYITSTTLSSDNSTISVTFSEAVFNTTSGSGNLEISDFHLAISGGVAKLSYTHPYSITKSGNVYTLGLPLSNLANGSEVVTVTPVVNSIYDSVGNVASTSQSNNTVTLNHKLGPIISSTVLASSNLTLDLSFSENVYGDNSQQTSINVNDIKLILTNGQATLTSVNPSSISVSNNVYTIGIPLSGIPNGNEVLTVLPESNSIFDSAGNVAIISNQANNTVTLNEKIVPYIIGSTISNDNLIINVTFSELVYTNSNGSGNLQTSDFLLTLSNNGLATFAGNTFTSNPNTIQIANNTYSLGVPLATLPNGVETLTITPVANSIFDARGNVASTTQSNNSITLYKQNKPYIVSSSINKENSIITILFSEAVYHLSNGTGSLQNSNFKYTISGGKARLGQSYPTTLLQSNNYFYLGIQIIGIPDGNETITILPYDATSIYDSEGNSAGTSQINNTVVLNEKIIPYITKTIMSENNEYLTVTFSEEVYSNSNGTGLITANHFIIKSNPRSEDFVVHESPDRIEKDSTSYKLYFTTRKTVTYGGLDIFLRNPVYDAAGNQSLLNQKNNIALFNTIRQFQPQELAQIKNNTLRLINRKRVIGNSTSGKTSSVNGFNSNASVNGGSK